MSSVRGNGGFRGRGRARGGNTFNAQGNTTFRGQSSNRGGFFSNAPRRANTTGRGAYNPRGRGNGAPVTRGRGGAISSGTWQDRQEQLQRHREQEKKDAIAHGLMSDPDKQIGLSEAITVVGTCQDMCPENERVLRTVRNEVWAEEKDTNQAASGSSFGVEPDEARMVKAFRRSAAGDEVQLPSDLRPPTVLKRTCDYLFNEVIGSAPSLEKVHHFVWDRTRAIRNDFSIQQLTKLDDVRIGIDCYERIARFHIASLHELSGPKKPYAKYDPQQEREQLDRTLLSLMQYYDDTRGRLDLPNEAEFRAYCVILQLRDPTPDLEDRIQSWPPSIARDYRVRSAVEVYTAACSTIWPEGPIDKTQHLIARQDWDKFWKLIESRKVSFLLGCVAETHFMMIREMALSAVVRSARVTKKKNGVPEPNTEWSPDDINQLFYFDNNEDLDEFCGRWNLQFQTREDDGVEYLDIRHLAGKPLPNGDAAKSSPAKSVLVEGKRHGRTIPAVIDGLSVRQAREAGLIEEVEEDDGGEAAVNDAARGGKDAAMEEEDDGDSLFVPETKPVSEQPTKPANPFDPALKPPASGFGSASSPFAQPNPSPFAQASDFGRPSSSGSPFNPKPAETSQTSDNMEKKSPFNFLAAPKDEAPAKPASASPFASTKPFDFSAASTTTTSGMLGGSSGAETIKSAPSAFAQPATTPSLFANPFAPKAAAPSGTPTIGTPSTAAPEKGSTQTNPFSFLTSATKPEQSSNPFAPKAAAGDAAPIASSPTAAPEKSSTQKPLFSFPSAASSLEQSNPFAPKGAGDTPTANPPTATPEKKQAPLFSFSSLPSKPEQPPTLDKPAFSFGLTNGAPAAPSLSAQPETNLKSPPQASQASFQPQSQSQPQPHPPSQAQSTLAPQPQSPSQPHSTSNAQQPAHTTQNATISNSGSQSPPRRPSASNWEAHKTKKPSPLSNSFTAGEDSSTLLQSRQNGNPSSPQTRPARPPTSEAEIELQKLAEILTFNCYNGFLKQFLDYSTKQVILEVQEKVFDEKCKIKCRALEERLLIRKYGLWWRAFARHRRLAAKSRQRRERTRERLRKSMTVGSLDGHSDADTISTHRGSITSVGRYQRDKKDVVDALFKSVAGDLQATAGSKRTASSNGRAMANNREPEHRREKSMSHVDDRGRVSKGAPTSHPDGDVLKRSSFLGYSTTTDLQKTKSTTKTPYFRMKALGLGPQPGSSATNEPRGTKRQRSESFDLSKIRSSRRSTPSSGALVPSEAPTPEQQRDTESMPPPAAKPRAWADDELLARLKAAREALMEGETFMKDELRTSMGSQSSNESPSMERARAEARLRMSQGQSDFDGSTSGRSVPAYQLRDSRFVPREEYGLARERALQRRASRSGDNSRSVSRAEERIDDTSNTTKPGVASKLPGFGATGNNASASTMAPPSKVNGQAQSSQPPASKAGTLFAGLGTPAFPATPFSGFGAPQASSQATSRNPFSQSTSFAPAPSAGSNPFLALGTPSHAGNDQTVQPSQINQSLAHTFGRPTQNAPTTQGSALPPDSYMPSQAASMEESLLPGDEGAGFDEVSYGQAQFYGNGALGLDEDQSGTQSFDEEATAGLLQGAHDYVNPFAALADQTGEDDDEDEDDQQNDGEEWVTDEEIRRRARAQVDSYQYSDEDVGEDDGDAPNGYVDEEAEEYGDDEDEGEGDFDEEVDYDEDEEDEDATGPWIPLNTGYRQPAAPPAPNPALQTTGNSAEDAIELSD